MKPALAALLILEMLHCIGGIDAATIDPRFLESTVKQFAGGPDKWVAFEIFPIARLLAHQRQIGMTRSLAQNRTGSTYHARSRLKDETVQSLERMRLSAHRFGFCRHAAS